MLLLKSQYPENTLVWSNGQKVSRGAITYAASKLAQSLPDEPYAINVCNSQLSFLLAFMAATLRQQITLLPPNFALSTMSLLKKEYPRHFVLDDSIAKVADLQGCTAEILEPNANAPVITLFTSGSTGIPQAHSRTWRTLALNAELDLKFLEDDLPFNIVSTVPPQHGYGLQMTIILPLLGRSAVLDGRPLYPADVGKALRNIPEPRVLVTTPAHLNVCVASRADFPELHFVLTTAAPIEAEQARAAEALWHTRVLDIYGSTETGTIAWRRPAISDIWQLLPNVKLGSIPNGTEVRADHLLQPIVLSDGVEQLSQTEFRLIGRLDQQIKIAGKRALLSDLTGKLLNITGVTDGVVFMPRNSERTAALVVTQRSSAEILDALARFIDPVFLPRPLLVVNKIPRNEVGKLTDTMLREALQTAKLK